MTSPDVPDRVSGDVGTGAVRLKRQECKDLVIYGQEFRNLRHLSNRCLP
jgi:hypothetical protein